MAITQQRMLNLINAAHRVIEKIYDKQQQIRELDKYDPDIKQAEEYESELEFQSAMQIYKELYRSMKYMILEFQNDVFDSLLIVKQEQAHFNLNKKRNDSNRESQTRIRHNTKSIREDDYLRANPPAARVIPFSEQQIRERFEAWQNEEIQKAIHPERYTSNHAQNIKDHNTTGFDLAQNKQDFEKRNRDEQSLINDGGALP